MKLSSRLRRILRRAQGSAERSGDPDGYRMAVGGLWEEMGRFQLDLMTDLGLEPSSTLLDVGCGAIRAGRHFIRYLDSGNYVGIDRSVDLLGVSERIVRKEGLTDKDATLVRLQNFEFDRLGRSFDFALAHSVFTHIPLNSIIRCLANVERVLRRGGRFYATFLPGGARRFELEPCSHPQPDGPPITTTFDGDPYHHSVEIFEWICEDLPLRVGCLGERGHPRGQQLLVFERD